MCKYCDSVLNVKVVTFPIYDNAEENIPKNVTQSNIDTRLTSTISFNSATFDHSRFCCNSFTFLARFSLSENVFTVTSSSSYLMSKKIVGEDEMVITLYSTNLSYWTG